MLLNAYFPNEHFHKLPETVFAFYTTLQPSETVFKKSLKFTCFGINYADLFNDAILIPKIY